MVTMPSIAQAAPGDLDPTFGGDGEVTTHFTAWSDESANAVAIQADGKIVAAGGTFSAFYHDKFALARYNADGTLDTSFGGDGKVTTHFAAGSEDGAHAVAIQANGKIVAAGNSHLSNERFALARYNSDGKLDTSFGGDGKVTTRFAAGSYDFASAVAIQPDGKVVAAGDSSSPFLYFDKFALARYNSDGKL